MIISNDLFNKILVDPMRNGANKLYVVSGYATAAMAFNHMQYVKEHELDIRLHLIVGMCSNDGLSKSNHSGFKKLVEDDFQGFFECSYVSAIPAVHSKVYAWLCDDRPIFGFAGSANYTQTAFNERQKEVMTLCNPQSAHDYYGSLLENSIYCTHNDVDGLIKIYQDRRRKKGIDQPRESSDSFNDVSGLESVTVSLLTQNGLVPLRSGLNWGQRPDRNKNQAYISLRSSVYNTDFFPDLKVHFTVLTDDGKTIICSRAQQQSKAIHTPHNNALLGEYFRNRLGLSSGAFVTVEDLQRYGRSDVQFYKIDNETYYMDFSV